MENNGKMIGLQQEEEIELDLGLSIGCSFKNPEKPNSIKNETVQSQHRIGPRTSSFEVDPQVKREIEAFRRQEAKRKRQEKQHKKINGDNYKLPDLETKRGEFDVKEGECKRSRVEEGNKTEMQNVNLNFTVEQNINLNKTSAAFSCNQKDYSSTLYPYPALHYDPFTNGLQHPCSPCLAGGGGAGGLLEEPGLHAVNVCVNSDENRRSGSNGSPVCSSSLVSDYRSSSYEGGGSSDARSHSSHSLPEQNPLHGSRANDTNDQFEHSAPTHSRETAQVYDKTTNCTGNCIKQKIQSDTAQFIPITKCTTNTVDQQTIPSNIVQFRPTKPKGDQPVSSESQVSTSVNPSLKESKRDTGKPPKPQSQNQVIHCLQQMPCVSTTGNGPNGKTINGFLYRYTKTELSIICVCHGTSMSPAEFVQHAGGTEVSHPLRHITVIPSTF